MSTLTKIDVPAGKHVLRILDSSGHTDVIYDPAVETEVNEAMATFDESMAKGMLAFTVDSGGGTGTVTRTFDQTAEQVVMVPQTVGG